MFADLPDPSSAWWYPLFAESATADQLRELKATYWDYIKAKYKLEIAFRVNPVAIKGIPDKCYIGAMSFMQNGYTVSGRGDSKLYMCPTQDCGEIVNPSELVKVCPKCGNILQPDALLGELFLCLPITGWASKILVNFARLGCNADINVILHQSALQKSIEDEIRYNGNGNIVYRARRDRHKALYTLSHMIKDSPTYADLEKSFHAFLSNLIDPTCPGPAQNRTKSHAG